MTQEQDPKSAAESEREEELERGVSSWAVAWRQLKRDRIAMFAGASLLALGVVALLSPLIANDKPLMARYRGSIYFPAFKDYLDENIPIPFGIPAALQRNATFFSPAYADVPEMHPGGQMLPSWVALRREMDSPEGDQRGDWYVRAPIPYYYKQTSSAIKQLPFADVAHLYVLDGPASGRHLELVTQSVWADEWTRLRSFEPEIDLSSVALLHTAVVDGQEKRWVVRRSEDAPPESVVTLDGQALDAKPVPLKEGAVLGVGGRALRYEKPTAHIMGTDDVGRDVCSRLIHGTVIAGSVGVVSVGIYVIIGVVLGALAGYFRGWVDIAISRLIEIVICFPTFFLIITIVALWEPSIYNIMIALGLVGWTSVARLVRGEFLKAMSEDYVQAARALGLGHGRIIFRHILPNAIAPVFVSASFGVAGAILVESSLSFLGFGVQPPTASWGEILRQGRNYINENQIHLVWFPGIAIFFTVTMFNLLGEGLRDALDPRLRQ